MSEENEQAQDVQEQEETSAVEVELDSDLGQDDETVTIASSKLKSLRYKARAYDATKDKPQVINKSSDEKWKQKMELKVEGYDDEQVDFLMKLGGKKALETPHVKAAIEAIKVQKQAEQATLASEGSKSSSEKGFSQSEFAKLPAEEQLKVLSGLK